MDRWDSEFVDVVFGVEQEIKERISELKGQKIVTPAFSHTAEFDQPGASTAVINHSPEVQPVEKLSHAPSQQTPRSHNPLASPGTHASSGLQFGREFIPTTRVFSVGTNGNGTRS